MSMFRRPTDDSSDSSSSSEDSSTEELEHSNAGTEEIAEQDLTTTRTLSSGESISVDHSHDETGIADVDHVRNMMLASLLEEFYRTRAAELFQKANPGSSYTRQSPEIQPLARNLFAQASQALISNDLLPASVVSNEVQNLRQQYLTGFDNFGLQNIRDSDLLSALGGARISTSQDSLALVKPGGLSRGPNFGAADHPVLDLAQRAEHLSVVPHPLNEIQLSSTQPYRSHYQSSFQEMRLLGRGGFGRVYQTFNIFDKREYAVKKIPLSPKLSQRYREKGHEELANVLREVQALAQMDHCNVVRYHATWIEDPATPSLLPSQPKFRAPFPGQKLIADKPASSVNASGHRHSSLRMISYGVSDGIKFEADSTDGHPNQDVDLGWSHQSHSHQHFESSMQESDIFTDGMARSTHSNRTVDDPTCYVLHVQMSMYPTTLAQYLSAATPSVRRGSYTSNRRHCFHLIPALRILLGVLCGIQYIHAQGLIHRDIKPSNIFLSNYETGGFGQSSDGYCDVGSCPSCTFQQPYHVNPRIGDFGLVADLARDGDGGDDSRSSSSGAVGTEFYRPPIHNGKQAIRVVNEKLDVYALGVILVEMLWQCDTSMERINLLKHVQREHLPRPVVESIDNGGYPTGTGKRVEDCIRGMMHKNQTQRWNCAKVKEEFDSILQDCMGHLSTE